MDSRSVCPLDRGLLRQADLTPVVLVVRSQADAGDVPSSADLRKLSSGENELLEKFEVIVPGDDEVSDEWSDGDDGTASNSSARKHSRHERSQSIARG